tara:strand:+ start:112 stop:555 length:444 start_codon:yes stop_codon:yes gene_type:complete
MANMSAKIIRNLVSSVFNVKAQNVILSGEIKPDYSITNNENVAYTDSEQSKSLFGFSPKKGFTKISEVVTTVTYFNGNHNHSTELGCVLSEVKGIDEYLFFVEKSSGYTPDGNYENYTIFSAPNFKEYWFKIEQQDIARWEQWLQES